MPIPMSYAGFSGSAKRSGIYEQHVSLDFAEKLCIPQTLDCQHRVGCLRFGSRHRCYLGHEHANSVDVPDFGDVDQIPSSSLSI